MTLSFFPEVYPDELLHSTFARYHVLLRHRIDKYTQRDLFGSDGVRGSIDLPSHLDALMERLPRGHPYQVEQLIQGHTTLPYYSRFIPEERTAQVIGLMRGRRGDLIRRPLGLTAHRSPTRPYLMACRVCAASDVSQYGESYWHRCHQLPGVFVCAVHGAILLQTSVLVGQRRRHGLFHHLAEEVLAAAQPVELPVLSAPCLAGLAADTAWVLKHWNVTRNLAELQGRYRKLLESAGWLYPNGRIRIADLTAAFLQHYSEAGLEGISCSLAATGAAQQPHGGHWLHRLLVGVPKTQHPLHHFLAIRFLGATAESFFGHDRRNGADAIGLGPSASSEETAAQEADRGACAVIDGGASAEQPIDQKTARAESGPCRNPICRQYIANPAVAAQRPMLVSCPVCDFTYRQYSSSRAAIRLVRPGALWDQRLKELVADATVTGTTMASTLGVGITTVQRHAARLGVWRERWRINASFNPSRTGKVKRGSSVAATRTRHRATILDVRRRNRGSSRSEIQALAPSAYVWLRRHDGAWAEKHLPAKRGFAWTGSPCDWPQRDAKILALAEAAVAHMRTVPGKPRRISVNAIGLQIGHQPLLSERLDKLPRTAAFLASVTETWEEAARRRIGWATTQFVAEGVCPSENQFVGRVGLSGHMRRQFAREITAACEQIGVGLR